MFLLAGQDMDQQVGPEIFQMRDPAQQCGAFRRGERRMFRAEGQPYQFAGAGGGARRIVRSSTASVPSAVTIAGSTLIFGLPMNSATRMSRGSL